MIIFDLFLLIGLALIATGLYMVGLIEFIIGVGVMFVLLAVAGAWRTTKTINNDPE